MTKSDRIITVANHEIIVETDKLFGVWNGKTYKGYGAEKLLVWLPKKDVKGNLLCEKVDKNAINMPEWFAHAKGLLI